MTATRRDLGVGDTGQDVVKVQKSLGFPPNACDGIYGSVTEAGVQGFQAAWGLTPDGAVGAATWDALDTLDARMRHGDPGLDDALIQQIAQLASNSALARYSWEDRGMTPAGYTQGMALCFALAIRSLEAENPAALIVAQADTHRPDTDALSWYADEMRDMGWDNSRDGVDTLRHLWCLLIGLGPRESSGNHWEGRDMSASNTSADTAEAGLFQTSWNIRSCATDEMELLFDTYMNDPQGFQSQFNVETSPTTSNLDNYGGSEGTTYQWLSKFCPAFHVFVTAIGLRRLRQHWGPINRQEVELLEEADDLLKQVEVMIAGYEPTPKPPPEDVATVSIEISSTGPVEVIVNGNPLAGS